MNQTVILAAGSGSRLVGDAGVPKPLITVSGAPLIAHALAHAAESGCHEAVIVVGHDGQRVKQAIERMTTGLSLRFVSVPDASEPNGVSLLASEPFVREQFFVQMVDHVFTDTTLPKLIATPLRLGEAGRLLIDCMPGSSLDLHDATKVQLAGDRVVAIGKALDEWDAIDAGCFVLTPAVFDALRTVPASEPCTVSAGMRQLASRGALGAIDVWEVEWADVDTPADRLIAERLLRNVQPQIA